MYKLCRTFTLKVPENDHDFRGNFTWYSLKFPHVESSIQYVRLEKTWLGFGKAMKIYLVVTHSLDSYQLYKFEEGALKLTK